MKLESLDDIKYLCETYLWKGKGVLNRFAEFDRHNAIESELLEQFKKLDPGETYLHLEPITGTSVVQIYPIEEWKSCYKRHCQKKALEDYTRKQGYINNGIAIIVAPIMRKTQILSMLPESAFNKLVNEMIEKRNDATVMGLFKLYGVGDIKGIETEVTRQFNL